jgi:hypothetical protein
LPTNIFNTIQSACRAHGRDPDGVTILAASKNQTAEKIREVYAFGVRHFGENRLQEALDKFPALQDLAIHWHYIGRIQMNKLQKISEHFETIQSVDRIEVLEKLQQILESAGKRQTVYLQLNISKETTKAGFLYPEAESFFKRKMPDRFSRVDIAGLMTIGPNTNDRVMIAKSFAEIKRFYDEIRKTHPRIQVLSLGMSQDYDSAIQAGSTMLRLGTAIFGPRLNGPGPQGTGRADNTAAL